jgi:hypothetical protein
MTKKHISPLAERYALLASQAGFEPATYGLEVRCSIQLSYWDMHGAGEGNRTLVIGLEGRRSTIELHPLGKTSILFDRCI